MVQEAEAYAFSAAVDAAHSQEGHSRAFGDWNRGQDQYMDIMSVSVVWGMSRHHRDRQPFG